MERRIAKRGDRDLTLTRTEFELLAALMERPQRVMSRERILEEVWGYNSGVTTVDEGMAAIRAVQGDRYPAVIKADGLAAGKGVVIAADEAEARAGLTELLVEHRFGTDQVVVEECLVGPEVSLLALCDGVRALPLASAQDYKTSTEYNGLMNDIQLALKESFDQAKIDFAFPTRTVYLKKEEI